LSEGGAAGTTPRPRELKIRIESLSDLVFGLALSIGSLILIGKAPQSGLDLWVDVSLFAFSFAIVVLAWLGYSRSMAALPVEVPFALITNIVLLFLVALEPYLFYVLQSAGSFSLLDSASVAYALDLGGMFFMQAALAHLVVKKEQTPEPGQLPLPPAVVRGFKTMVKLDVIIGVVFFVSALPVFWVETPIGFLRFYLWTPTFFTTVALASRRWTHRAERDTQVSTR
jgi:uncharacterized membrane protein